MEKRIQLTLFVPEFDAREIELIREKYNPVQFALIAAHVTLCREDELLHLDQVLANLQQLKSEKIRIFFGPPRRFSEGKGVMIPAAPDNKSFHELRAKIYSALKEYYVI